MSANDRPVKRMIEEAKKKRGDGIKTPLQVVSAAIMVRNDYSG